ncbi:ammonia-forming cytochrome c nitrite reductase subunit c552 [Shewanella sp. VB17]|uniref:ammonia-forming cytochrome c nitrite reductase subunit c552 n=1 Tax=Shewanella sp. VB17 TaxID=2739432 RepID=UPI001567C10D|nr:ammonia-forming cytochrome c nitrite reductase subunit c552 [Shewanella sp. VB17]NRD74586.1 ammonia-forming cytochrome c nitrite reductase subunit c552 [Shewanella sp. VB17]
MQLIRTVLQCVILTCCVVCAPSLATDYVGNESCQECHRNEVKNWQGSDHAKAMQVANEETVLGDFNHVRFESNDGWTVFNKDDKGYYIETGSKGQSGVRYRVPYVFGYYPLQQILVDIGQGRLQAYTVAWDARTDTEGGSKWYDLYDNTHTKSTPFYWKGQFNNWNARCAECHSTHLTRGYEPDTDSYKTRWSEINVSCESCHGPAATHLKLKKQGKPATHSGFDNALKKTSLWAFNSSHHTAVRQDTKPISVDHGQVDQCAACHSRRVALTDGAKAGNFSQHFIPRLAEPPLYHLDGQILDEVYVYGSFTQSKMAAAGVVCSNCHEPHSGKLLAEKNGLCLQCHKATTFDTPKHTLHNKASEGALCVNCHMPTTQYMGVDNRRDHAFRVPNPWVSEAVGSNDVCLSCHKDKNSQWSQNNLKNQKKQIFGHYNDIGPAILLNQQNKQQGQKLLRQLVLDKLQPAMRRAVLLGQLDMAKPENVQALNTVASDDESLVKLGVIGVLESSPYRLQLQIGFGLLYDDDKNVRMGAIKLLAPAFRQQIPEKAQKKLQAGLLEAVSTYEKQQDLLSAQLALADMAYKVGDLEQAQVLYSNAIKLQPSFLPAKLNLASIYREMDQLDKSKMLLKDILKIAPNHAMALHNLGLVYVIQQQWPDALSALAKAAEFEPDNSRFQFVLTLALEASGNIDEALKHVQQLESITPGDPALADLRKRLKAAKVKP